MPSETHPQAKFDPIPPDLDLHALVDRTDNFEWVLRVSADQIRRIGPQEFEKVVDIHVIKGGKPLVIEKWNNRLPSDLFSVEWLEAAVDKKQENVWDIGNQTNIPMTTGHYLRSMKQLADQWTPNNFRDERRQRLYLKDIDCPPEWHDRLQKVLPRNLFYLNENIEDRNAARNDDNMFVDDDGHTAAPAGDLMSSLPEQMRAQNLMCYIGHEGTYTPGHREMCASLGQNIMVEASGSENGEKPGSSIWFMTESKDREVVREYFLSMLGHDVEIEKHFAQINAWKKANFDVYIVEQKPGDFILVPPLAVHQVWNRGTRTVKVAWNRTTVETLEMAMHEALPKARLVCRDEQYKNKAMIYYTLQKYYRELQSFDNNTELSWLGINQNLMRDSVRTKQLNRDFKKLLALFTEVLVGEMFSSKEKDVEFLEFDSNITCSYCRCNIFNRFLTCKHCIRPLIGGDEDTYDICMECYAMGRSCLCISGLSWCEQWNWSELVDNYEAWRTMVIKNDGFIDMETSPLPLEVAMKKTKKKSVAHICQEQLRRRPFNDVTKKRELPELEPEDIEVDDNGNPKKKPSRKKKKGEVYRCHVCCHKDYTYKLRFCSNPGCNEAYCYGVLYRAFDLLPQAVLEVERWSCPKCEDNCNCAACRRIPGGQEKAYIPKKTLLGHDTKRVADDRSVESLVDFRYSNLGWLKNVGEESRSQNTKRMAHLQQAAHAEKVKEAELHKEGDQADQEPTEADASASQPAPINGYGDQSHIPGVELDPVHQLDGALANGQEVPDATGNALTADMSIAENADESAYPELYPEPIPFSDRRLGMGYYEQDDSEDKILFDPYQQPQLDAFALEDEQQSEWLKKSLRAAKRRARLEDDRDPDFAGPKSHKKKRVSERPPPQADESVLDPALLGEDSIMQDAPADIDPSLAGPAAQPEASMDIDQNQNGALQFPANVPSLRHAKPVASYLEPADGEMVFDETYIPKPKPVKNPIPSIENGDRDSLDPASALLRSAAANAGPGDGRRGRGRPKKSELEARRSSRVAELNPPEPEKPKGRVSRVSMLAGQGKDRAEEEFEDEPIDEDETPPRGENSDDEAAELEAQLAAELRDGDADFRPSKPASKPAADGQPRKRGRPPKNPAAAAARAAANSSPPSASKPADSRFLSMAERMALKGKKFKIGPGRKSGGGAKDSSPAQPSPSISIDLRRSETAEPGQNSPAAGPSTSAKATPSGPAKAKPAAPPQASPPRKGPTVVRLGDSEDEEDSFSGVSGVSSEEDSDDDDDIPAGPRASIGAAMGRARRGGPTSLRGRGRPRGRGGHVSTIGRG